MSWIDDAKSQAKINKQEDEIIESRFFEVFRQAQSEIERVVNTARDQGLIIESEEGYSQGGIGNILFKKCGRSCGFRDYSWTERYKIIWTIFEITTSQRMQIRLEVYSNDNNKTMRPTTNAAQVEAQIKAWLVEIFSQ